MSGQCSLSAAKIQAFVLALSVLSGFQISQGALAGDTHFSSQALQAPPKLPYLPDFGGTFVRGHEFPMLSNTQCWVLKYEFAGTGPQVISSIEKSLPGQGWTIDSHQAKAEQFTAERRKDHVSLSVRTQPGRKAGSTVATIRYILQKS